MQAAGEAREGAGALRNHTSHPPKPLPSAQKPQKRKDHMTMTIGNTGYHLTVGESIRRTHRAYVAAVLRECAELLESDDSDAAAVTVLALLDVIEAMRSDLK